jgi:2-dehydro-3-deoxygalactonokinase
VDWGTTSFRAALVSLAGTVLAQIETPEGIQLIPDRAYEPVLMRALEGWFAAHGPLPVVALGMITSRTGWVEVPYVCCPARAADLAAGTFRQTLPNGAKLIFLAGLTDPARKPFADVMRGEETQILGFGVARDATLVLPGTHSKWARLRSGAIESFQTFVTGEIFALLSQHSFIAKAGAGQNDPPDWAAFDRGVAEAASEGAYADAFLSLLFSARTGMLAGALGASQILDYVSGLVIGHEFREARGQGWFKTGDAIGIVGNDELNLRYGKVAQAFGLRVLDGGEGAAIAGAMVLCRLLGEERPDAD